MSWDISEIDIDKKYIYGVLPKLKKEKEFIFINLNKVAQSENHKTNGQNNHIGRGRFKLTTCRLEGWRSSVVRVLIIIMINFYFDDIINDVVVIPRLLVLQQW